MKKIVVLFGIAYWASIVGCKSPSQDDHGEGATSAPTSELDAGQDNAAAGAVDHTIAGHAHGAGPHGGTIADWGGGTYHVEFTVDHEKKQATAYVLGPDEKTPTPISSETIELSIKEPAMQLVLNADPQDGDPEGKSSRFVGIDEKLQEPQEYEGTLTGVVEGTPYSGDFSEQ